MVDNKALVESLKKFQRYSPDDAAFQLMRVLGIDEDAVMCLVGGSNAPIFRRAMEEIQKLREQQKAAKPTRPIMPIPNIEPS